MPREETKHESKPERREAAPRPNRRTDAPGRTPGKAEGEERDIDEALKRQKDSG